MSHAALPPEEPKVEKPRPLRNWRDYTKEYAVVVLGVLTALLLEQVVVNWREHRQYLEAREAMRAELATNIANFVYRPAISACAISRLAEIGVLLDMAEKHQPFAAPSWVGEASTNRFRFSAEGEAARSGLFSPEEQRQFSTLYAFLHQIDQEMERERLDWKQLQALEGRTGLPPEMIADLRQALAGARFQDRRIQQLMGFFRANARTLSLPLAPPSRLGLPPAWSACVPMDTPRDEAIRQTAYPGTQ